MSYSTAISVYQTNPSMSLFSPVENTVWNYANGGTWSNADGVHTLTMGGSGTSGTIRLSNGLEYVLFAVGVHNYKPWCDVEAGLQSNDTGTILNGYYYNGPWTSIRQQQLTDCNATSPSGTQFELKYTVTSGNNLAADIIIG